jgi:hypothetical protein
MESHCTPLNNNFSKSHERRAKVNNTYLKRVVALVFSVIIALIGFGFLRNAANWGFESINNYVRTKMGGEL